MERTGPAWGRRALGLVVWTTAILLVLPIGIVVVMSFNPALYLAFPPRGLSLKWYRAFLDSVLYLQATRTSLVVSTLAVGISGLVGTMTAYAISRFRFRLRHLVYGAVLSPLLLPGMILGVALLYLFSGWNLQSSFTGVVVVHVLYTLPFVVVVVAANLQSVGRQYEEMAMSLGASRLYAFRTVTLPLIRSGIITGMLFSFVLSLDEFVMTYLIGGVHVITLPIRIFSALRFSVDPTIAAVSTLMILLALLLYVAHTLTQALGRKSLSRSQEGSPVAHVPAHPDRGGPSDPHGLRGPGPG